MRIMPIDEFLEETEASRTPAVVPASPIDGRSYDWNRIVSEGRAARAAADGGAWHIGHLALLVEKRYRSGTLQRFAEAIGESYGTVRRFRWVAGAYEPTVRTRFTGLTFSHFQAVASLPDRLLWLQRAYRRGWSVDRLVQESRKATTGRAPSEALLRKPIEAASRRLARLCDELDAEALDPDARAHLTAAVDDLAEQLATLRARLAETRQPSQTRRRATAKRRATPKRGASPKRLATLKRKATPKRRVASVR